MKTNMNFIRVGKKLLDHMNLVTLLMGATTLMIQEILKELNIIMVNGLLTQQNIKYTLLH